MNTCTRLARLGLALMAFSLLAAGGAQAQKYGGIMKAMQQANPATLSMHETATINTSWAVSPVYNNLLYYDPLKPVESLETVIPELAREWNWNGDYTQFTLKLREGVRWHDGKPFTSADVKHTFDLVRGVSSQRFKTNPRKGWYGNVKDVKTNGDFEVVFSLKKPQPALLQLLAAGYSVVIPAHVPVEKLRTDTLGTGPFKLAEYKRDQAFRVRKNPDYFIKGRPYLDGIDFLIITNRATRMAALQTGQVEINQPVETDQKTYDILRQTTPEMEYNKMYLANNVNVVMNNKRPPFTNSKLRQAINMSLNRGAFVKAVLPGYLPGAFMLPRPYGTWGIDVNELKAVPGFRDPAVDKEEARKLMRELGYNENNRLKLKVTTRTLSVYVDGATWFLGEVKQIYIDAELEIVEDGAWYPRQYRRDYDIAWNGTGYAVDDPDVVYPENFACDSLRNYTNYCDPEAERLFAQQSATIDQKERLKLVQQIEHKLIDDVARISLAMRVSYYARRNYVKDFLGHNTIYSISRFQDVWLDK
ncbi:MAG: ABC transporter substrate-binding protein [Candidatus Lambdaproteobacteria bacterium]|nr:ABC transporter substrate-binding protein [Candidatus Lambdaproteobacteria bacterium]